jgi:2-polyprenyl-3-methyl-5-hydroxy-6-metoxy-1,4-benzoquinol methylase
MVDQAKLEAFMERFIADAAATAHAATVVLGDKLGLYKMLATGGPQTARELAERTGCHPRLVLEWLRAQVASEYCVYNEKSDRYSLTEEQIECLATEGSPASLIGNVHIVSSFHRDEEGVRRAYSGGPSFGWHEHHGDLFTNMARSSSADYGEYLITEWIPALEGVEAKLRAGARVADVGCGFGGPTIMLAEAFPSSTFHGFDNHEESIDTARKSAAQAGVSDRVTFEVAQASAFPGTYDLVCTFDAFHDMGDPVGVASHVRKALAPGGTWMIVELNASGDLLDNINPLGRFLYSASSFVCVPNALSQSDTEALGAAAGKEGLEAVVRQAGFTRSAAVAESLFNLVLEVRA